jgi:tetratricopeptide (TPR) repeat protein
VVLSVTGRRDEAIEAWKRALGADPAELRALFNLTVSLSAAGRGPEARPYAERFLTLAPASMGPDREQIRKLLAAIR